MSDTKRCPLCRGILNQGYRTNGPDDRTPIYYCANGCQFEEERSN